MRYHRSAAVLLSIAALPVAIPAAQATPPAGAGAGKVAPFTQVAGVSAEEAVVIGFVPNYTGERLPACNVIGNGKLLGSDPGVTCTVKPGTHVIVPLPGVSCSDAEPDPFFAEGATAQRACALAHARDDISAITVTVDGGPPQDVRND